MRQTIALTIIIILVSYSCKNKASLNGMETEMGTLKETAVVLTAKDLSSKSLSELRILRNEIFARHGYIFKSQDLDTYFSQKDWYKPQFVNVNSLLTDQEKLNIKLIRQREEFLNSVESGEQMYYQRIKGCREFEEYYFSVVSIFEYPPKSREQIEDSYHRYGHYIVLTEYDPCDTVIVDIDLEAIQRSWVSNIEIVNPCSDIEIGQLQYLDETMFSTGSRTIRFLKPDCNHYTENIFIEYKNGRLIEKFTQSTWVREEINFERVNDSIFFTLIDGRDEIVSQFQRDYRLEYNTRTNKQTRSRPNKQVINWESEAFVELTAYKTIAGAQYREPSDIAFKVLVGDEFDLDTLYRNRDALLIILKKDKREGYLNTDGLNYKKISYNGAG